MNIDAKNTPVKIRPAYPPQVSIGMPVYNGEPFIREALDSLLAQTFTDFELIISDNGSTDATETICKEYAAKDVRIRYVRQLENQGAVTNFLFVLNDAVGECFMWAAADDVWSADWLDALYGEVQTQKRVTAIFGGLRQIDGNSKEILTLATNAKIDFSGSMYQRLIKFFLMHESRGKANLFYSLYRTDSLRLVDLSAYKYDYQVLHKLLQLMPIIQISGPLLSKRVHSESAGSTQIINSNNYLEKIWMAVKSDLKFSIIYFKGDSVLALKAIQAILIPLKILFGFIARLENLIAKKGRIND